MYSTTRNVFANGSYGWPFTVAHKANVIVAIPCYNEEVAVGSIVLRALKYANRVIVIDDGSRDETAEVARLAGADVIVHETNIGKGAAVKDAFEYANKEWTDILVLIDGDGQHNPDEIPKIVDPIFTGEADMVIGSRYLNGNGKNTPRYRRFGQRILDKFTSLNSGMNVTDTQSGFRAFAMHVTPIFKFNSNGLDIESEMLADAAEAKLRVKEVEIGVRYDVGRSTEHPLRHGIRVLTNILNNIEFRRPLIYFTVPGLVLFLVGLVMGLNFLRDFYLGKGLYFGPTLLMILMTLIGTFMIFTGMILHSLSQWIRRSTTLVDKSI